MYKYLDVMAVVAKCVSNNKKKNKIFYILVVS